ncbi:hypothetical protein DY000_02018832 [Brassica cretica]|uniref:Uncharacterized protein n=1 Tax=Brassica cretica TaxID=69181 RepID=A0ABQ7CNL8_BRACR|nr:hypothetical protein DY000_02018832 [Brassica cretica]
MALFWTSENESLKQLILSYDEQTGRCKLRTRARKSSSVLIHSDETKIHILEFSEAAIKTAELRSLTTSSGSTLRRSVPDAANFTGGSRKLHQRIETEATPQTLFERKERNSRRELEDVEVFHCCLHLGFELEEVFDPRMVFMLVVLIESIQ